MFVISPLSRCASPEKRDIFLDHIAKIACVTKKNEPQCHGYGWFKSAEDNDTVPHYWLRGFEIYEDIEANTTTHRASVEYKAFRVAVAEEKLLEQPSDLRFWLPTGVGFLTRNKPMDYMSDRTHGDQYVVVDELSLKPGQNEVVSGLLQILALEAENTDQCLSFWVLSRNGERDPAFLIFACWADKEAWSAFVAQAKVCETWKAAHDSSEQQRRTTWIQSGLGFIGR